MQALEGIILKTVRLQEANEILTLFSKELGIVSLIVKRRQQSFSPLLKIEAEVMVSDKDLKKCRHVQVTGSFQGLRTSLEKLEYAARMAQWIERQLPRQEPVEALYTIFDEHLQALCIEKNAEQVATRFMKEWKTSDGTFSLHYSDEDLLRQLKGTSL